MTWLQRQSWLQGIGRLLLAGLHGRFGLTTSIAPDAAPK